MSDNWLGPALGRSVRQARADARLTQAELAREAGISRASVVNIEQGRQGVSVSTLYQLARAVGRAPGDLLPAPPEDLRWTIVAGSPDRADARELTSVLERAKESTDSK